MSIAALSVVATAALSGCIDREYPPKRFACGLGGACPDVSEDVPDAEEQDASPQDSGARDAASADATSADAGRPDAGRPDAGRPDAGRLDAGLPDSGVPLAQDAGPTTVACTPDGEIPFTGNLYVLSGSMNRFDMGCNRGGVSNEVVYQLDLPVAVTELRIDTVGSSFDTVLALYRDQCGSGAELSCNDDSNGTLASTIALTNVAAGVYFVVVEGYGGRGGEIRLNVKAKTPENACSPLPFIECPRTVGAPHLAAGDAHTCAESLGAVRCWGRNDSGQLGRSAPSMSASPLPVTGLDSSTALGAGADFACSVAAASGNVACWGLDDRGQLAQASPGTVAPPAAVNLPGGALSIAGGDSHTCAVLFDQAVACWGGNDNGELGDGTSTSSTTPLRIPNLEDVVVLDAGAHHNCAVLVDGTVWCWGANTSGQLGDGTLDRRLEPVSVPGVEGAVAVATGDAHTCALIRDGTVQCFGNNDSGQLGDGTTNSRPSAAPVAGLTTAVEIAAGGRHTCAVLSAGGVVCWGDNAHGQLGDGTTSARSTPTAVLSLASVGNIALGDAHGCASLSDGEAYCWGKNSSGQVGTATTTDVREPEQALSGASFSVTARGAIQRWLVLGAFSNNVCGVVDAAAIDEPAASPRPNLVQAGATWSTSRAECIRTNCASSSGIDLNCQYGGSSNVYAYLFAYVTSPDERAARMLTGHDDGLIAYLNGAEVPLGQRGFCAPCTADTASAPVTLHAGVNRVLIKIGQGGGSWEATVRFTTTTGEPMTDLSTSLTP